MNKLFFILVLVFSIPVICSGEGMAMDETRKAELHVLLYDFPDWATLAHARSILRSTTSSPLDLRGANEQIARAKERLPKVRGYFKVGTPVFDYPGILQVGRVQLLPPVKRDDGSAEYGYRVSIGLNLDEEFIRSSDFFIEFDSRGLITKIADIVAAHWG